MQIVGTYLSTLVVHAEEEQNIIEFLEKVRDTLEPSDETLEIYPESNIYKIIKKETMDGINTLLNSPSDTIVPRFDYGGGYRIAIVRDSGKERKFRLYVYPSRDQIPSSREVIPFSYIERTFISLHKLINTSNGVVAESAVEENIEPLIDEEIKQS